MSGLSHSKENNRFIGATQEKLSFQAARLLKPLKQERIETGSLILTEGEALPPSRRLVVILPDASFDVFALPKRIWELAAPDRRQVLLLTKPCREENEFHLRMTLTTLAAQIRDSRVVVQTQLVLGMSLDQAVRHTAKPDDVFVCFEEHRVPAFLSKKNWLKDNLAQKTHLPVYTLKGAVAETADPISDHLIDYALLAVSLALLIGFFALQVWIDKNTAGLFHTILEILTVIVEAWIISACMKRSFRI